MTYDGQADDGDQFTFVSKLTSTTIDPSSTNNTIALTQLLTLAKNGSTIGDTVWIDSDSNGIQ
jgi:hypothetical protein